LLFVLLNVNFIKPDEATDPRAWDRATRGGELARFAGADAQTFGQIGRREDSHIASKTKPAVSGP